MDGRRAAGQATNGKEKRENTRKREREKTREKGGKKGSGSGRKGSTDIYNGERGQGAGLRRVHRGYVHRHGRYIDTYVRAYT